MKRDIDWEDEEGWARAREASAWVLENLRREEMTDETVLEMMDMTVEDWYVSCVTPIDERIQREFELQPDEIDDATIDELISHLEARDRYRFGGFTNPDSI